MNKSKFLPLLLSIILVINSITPVNASHLNSDDKMVFALSETERVEIIKTNTQITTQYYKHNKLVDYAIKYADNDNIYYFDNRIPTYNLFKNNNTSKVYNINDFKVNSFSFPSIYRTSSSEDISWDSDYRLLKKKTFNISNTTYKRTLYGKTGKYEVLENSWHYNAGTALSIILTVLSAIFSSGMVSIIISCLSVSGGVLLSSATLQYFRKYHVWKYKCIQTSPEFCRAYTEAFKYKSFKEIRINSSEHKWEEDTQFAQENSSVYSSAFRDNILLDMFSYATDIEWN